MKRFAILTVVCVLGFCSLSEAQRVVYSEPDKDDLRSLNFEIIGKYAGNFLVYKNTRDDHFITAYDNEMKTVEKQKLDFLPDRVLNAEFITYPDFFYMLYQYQRKSVMYMAAVQFDQAGKVMKEPVILDTTDINFFANATSRLYSVINSENKEFISIIKINSKHDDNHFVGNVLLDKNLQRISKTRIGIAMPERNDFLTEFTLDNDGDLVFVQASGTSTNDNINKVVLCMQPKGTNTVSFFNPGLKDVFLDDVKVKVNNANKQYLISSFYSKSRRGAIEGLYTSLFDKSSTLFNLNRTVAFSEAFRGEAKGENGMKNAFDDYFLQHIIMRKDGGFLVTAEANYQTTRGNTFSRWDYLNSSPFWRPNDYYMWRSYGYTAPWWRYYGGGNTSATTRYFADNIAIVSFNNKGDMEWNGVINKAQFDDNTDNTLSYSTMITGGEIHFLYNSSEKRTLLLTDQSVTSTGELKRNPTLKNLDRGYEFMPRYAKQVSGRQMIVPCQYRNYICFAKVEF
jgi:hypothetical protein